MGLLLQSRIRLAALATLPLVLLAGCAGMSGGGGFNFISVDEEWEMGAQFEEEIPKQMKVISDPQAEAFLNRLGQDLLAASRSPLARREWKFHLIKDDAVNACNVPGGHVYVHTGLIRSVDDYDEFAAVVGHEIGHGLARHGTSQLSKQFGLSLLLSIAMGRNTSAAEQMIASFVSGASMMKFSRDDELEADRLGIHLLYGAGIDPLGMLSMLEVLDSLKKSSPSRVDRFMSSHPMPKTRIEEARRRIETLEPKPGQVHQTEEFLAFQRRTARYN